MLQPNNEQNSSRNVFTGCITISQIFPLRNLTTFITSLYLSLRSFLLFEIEMDMMCVREGTYVRSTMMNRSSIGLAIPNLRKVSHK